MINILPNKKYTINNLQFTICKKLSKWQNFANSGHTDYKLPKSLPPFELLLLLGLEAEPDLRRGLGRTFGSGRRSEPPDAPVIGAQPVSERV